MTARILTRWTLVLLLWLGALVALMPPAVVAEWSWVTSDRLLTFALACVTAAAALATPEVGLVRGLRWTVAGCCLIWTLRVLSPGLGLLEFPGEDSSLPLGSGPFTMIAALLALVAAVVLVGPEMIRLAAWPLLKMVDSIVYPDEHFRRPPLDQRLALYYVRVERWDRAAEEYERMLHYYPAEPRLYQALMSLYTGPLGDSSAARSLWRRARWRLWRHPRSLHPLKVQLRRTRLRQEEVVLDG